MFRKSAYLIAASLVASLAVVSADIAVDDDPVLRLRLTDPLPPPDRSFKLRPRFDAAVTHRSDPVPMPTVNLSEQGAIGRFAFVSTVHPNLVIAVGATDDRSELGRQIDRAVIEMARGENLFNRQSDRAPFIGLGVRSGSPHSGWSADATIGAGFLNPPDPSRVTAGLAAPLADRMEAETRAHMRLRYRF